jgi:hypothetical protein
VKQLSHTTDLLVIAPRLLFPIASIETGKSVRISCSGRIPVPLK